MKRRNKLGLGFIGAIVAGVAAPRPIMSHDSPCKRPGFAVGPSSRKKFILASVLAVFASACSVRDAFAPAADARSRFVDTFILVETVVGTASPAWFLLDTGAGGTLIHPALAATAGLPQEREVEVTGGAGTTPARLVRTPTLLAGGVTVRDVEMAAGFADFFAGFSAHLGVQVDGVLGHSFLSRAPFLLSYADQRVRFGPRIPETVTCSGCAVELEFVRNKPSVALTLHLDGGRTAKGRFVLDTASDGAISVNAPFVDLHRLLPADTVLLPETHNTGIGGDSPAVVLTLPGVTIGGETVSEVVAHLSRGTVGNDATEEYAGTIGGGLLRHFDLVFDYAASSVHLRRRERMGAPRSP